MRWNWGTGIVVSFALFCGFIIYIVVRAFQLDVDLVSETYYKEELNFQQHIDNRSNLEASGLSVKTEQNGEHLTLNFPREFKGASGDVHFYHPSREIFDRHYTLALNSENVQVIDKTDLIKGRYKVKMNWNTGGKSYYQEEEIFVK